MFHFYDHRRWLMTSTMAIALLACSVSHSQAAILIYRANMSGAQEAPPNASAGTGTATITIDTTLNSMRVQATFSGLTGTTTQAHIHAGTLIPFTGTAGVATTLPSFVGFPLGVTSGSMDQTYDMTLASSYNAAYVTANGGTTASAFAALQGHIAGGNAYFNIHSSIFGGGEIRAFLVAVPEPSSMALLGTVLAGAGWRTWRRRQGTKA